MSQASFRRGMSFPTQRGGLCEAHRIAPLAEAKSPNRSGSLPIRRACAAAACQTPKNVKRLTLRARACVPLRATADPFQGIEKTMLPLKFWRGWGPKRAPHQRARPAPGPNQGQTRAKPGPRQGPPQRGRVATFGAQRCPQQPQARGAADHRKK